MVESAARCLENRNKAKIIMIIIQKTKGEGVE